MKDEIKIEFGADFKRWLIAKILLTTLVLSVVGGYLYHKISSAAEVEAAKEHQKAMGIEGTPILLGVTPDWFENNEKTIAKKVSDHGLNPGLKLTKMMIKGLELQVSAVVPAQERSLPPQIGTLNYDNETNFLIKCRFNGELNSFMQVKEKIKDEDGYDEIIERPVKFGDKVKQGDVLAVFWSVSLGTAKAAFVDAISAVRLSQDAYLRQLKIYNDSALPLATLKQAERQLQGDNNNLLTAERSLRMWKMTNEEIAALRKEANDIIDALLLVPSGRVAKIDENGMTLLLTKDDKLGTYYKFAKGCKFFKAIKKDGKDDKEAIKEGVYASIFQDLGKKDLGAFIVTNDKGDVVTEVVVAKVKDRDVLDEVNRWASTNVPVPWFDEAHPDRELTVVEKNTNRGDIVDNTNFGTWLFRVADLSKLQIWVHPPEELLPLIREGLKTYYAVDDVALKNLHGVPKEVLAKLANLKNRKLDKNNFESELRKQLDVDEFARYLVPIQKLVPLIREGNDSYYMITSNSLVALKEQLGVPDKVSKKLGDLKNRMFNKNEFEAELRKRLEGDEFARYLVPILKFAPFIREGRRAYYFTITDYVLADLQGVPDEVSKKLGSLTKNRKFDQDEFVAELKKLLDEGEFEKYQRPILKLLKKKGELKWEIRLQADPLAPPVSAPNAAPGEKGLLPVDMICPSLEPNQHNPMVVGYFPNRDHKHLVGQFVTATLKMPPEDNTVEIPTAAINEYNGQSFVFVENPDKNKPGEYFIKRVAIVRRYAEFSVVRSKLRPQDEKYSADEVKEGRYPLRPLERDERVVRHGAVELTTALENLITKESINVQNAKK